MRHRNPRSGNPSQAEHRVEHSKQTGRRGVDISHISRGYQGHAHRNEQIDEYQYP